MVRPDKKTEGRIEFAIQIAGELFPDNKEALIQMERVIKENDLWKFFLKKLKESELPEKNEILSFFEKL